MKRALPLAVLVLLAASPAAHAAAPPDAWQRKALATAQSVWHPACGQLRIEWASQSATNGTEDAAGWAWPGTCTVYLATEHEWEGYPELCDVVLHETGHITGRGHSNRGIMRPDTLILHAVMRIGRRLAERWVGADRRCIRPMDRR